SVMIYVIPNPIADLLITNAITPDADGYNDTWKIQGIEAFDNVKINIFNRWGDEIFIFDGSGLQYSDPLNQWDGKYKDRNLPSGSYLFILILDNESVHKGTISLIR
ncbi:MAG: gliding motility-associated C-terminal domain-containing protein, partial [Bacteroidales bacterium]|nr:gliding motility-associated C-terminal domain-containing protein [Bacteroidales bacterium]